MSPYLALTGFIFTCNFNISGEDSHKEETPSKGKRKRRKAEVTGVYEYLNKRAARENEESVSKMELEKKKLELEAQKLEMEKKKLELLEKAMEQNYVGPSDLLNLLKK